MWTESLRHRVALALLVWSLGTAMAFAFATYWAADLMEVLVLEQNLGATAQRIHRALDAGEIPAFPTEDWYWGGLEEELTLSSTMRALPPGSHHDVLLDGREFHVWIERVGQRRFFLIYDLARIEDYENRLVNFLLGCVVLMALAAVLIGATGTAWVMRPLRTLAGRLRHLPTSAPGFVAPQAADRDLAPMVAAIDDLLQRNAVLLASEVRFTRTASHELRTPLAAVQAALELALQQQDPASIHATLSRAERASRRLGDTVQVLLDFARREAGARQEPAQCCAAEVVAEQLAELAEIHPNHPPVQLDVNPVSQPLLERSILTILVSNLLGNAVQHGHKNGPIKLSISNDHLEVSNPLPADADSEPATAADRLGFGIVELLCEYRCWQLERRRTTEFFTVQISFGPGQQTFES